MNFLPGLQLQRKMLTSFTPINVRISPYILNNDVISKIGGITSLLERHGTVSYPITVIIEVT